MWEVRSGVTTCKGTVAYLEELLVTQNCMQDPDLVPGLHPKGGLYGPPLQRPSGCRPQGDYRKGKGGKKGVILEGVENFNERRCQPMKLNCRVTIKNYCCHLLPIPLPKKIPPGSCRWP